MTYPGAIWNPSPHFWQGHGGQRVRYVIEHGTAGFTTAQQVANFFHDDNPPTSTHFIVGRDGTVVQCVSVEDSAWGNGVITQGADRWWTGNPNWYTISIEHVKPDKNNATQLTAQQIAATVKLNNWICSYFGIPKQPANAQGGVTGHFSIDPVNRSYCPGTFPWATFFNFLGSSQTIANAPGAGPSPPPGAGSLGSLLNDTGSGGNGVVNINFPSPQDYIDAITKNLGLNTGWLGNFGWNILKLGLGFTILLLVGAGLLINIVGSDIITGVGLSTGSGAGKAIKGFAALAA